MMDNTSAKKIGSLIQNAHNILITSHVGPDWDAVGSVLGLGLAIQTTGKKVQMVLEDSISQKYHHLPGHEFIKREPNGSYDLSIVVDCSDISRMGNVLKNDQPDINIDHHVTISILVISIWLIPKRLLHRLSWQNIYPPGGCLSQKMLRQHY
jgi:phosphoesterase RecJ-like protein